MINYFEKTSTKGAFGEFVYQDFVSKTEFLIEPRRVCMHDFLIIDKENKYYRIDVKTTVRDIDIYPSSGRESEKIIYDLIKIIDNQVYLLPDKNSPFKEKKIFLGSFEQLLNQWNESKKNPKNNNKKFDDDELLASMKKKVKDYSMNSGYKIKFLFRGPSSKKKWSYRRPDNILKNLEISDFVVFIQLKCKNFRSIVDEIILLKNTDLNKIKLVDARKMQINKGILKVIDLNDYLIDFPNYKFDSIEKLIASLDKY